MMRISSKSINHINAEILLDKNPKTAKAIWNSLPFDTKANTWGDEIYFSIPVILDEENAQETVDEGDIGYWPPGKGFCIFFGPTQLIFRPCFFWAGNRPFSNFSSCGRYTG